MIRIRRKLRQAVFQPRWTALCKTDRQTRPTLSWTPPFFTYPGGFAMKRRNAFGTVLLAVGLAIVVASATSKTAFAQFPNGYMPNGYLPNGYGSNGFAIPEGCGSNGILIPGQSGSQGIEIPAGSCNGGIVWDGPGDDEEEEDLEILYFFSEEELSWYYTYPFRGSGGETSPNEVYRRAMDAIDDLFPWEILFPWGELPPGDQRLPNPQRK
jgi:hypothetical protein